MSGLGPIPPVDPQQDRALRQREQRRLSEGLLFVVLLFTQLVLAMPLGAWAAGGGEVSGYAAAGMLLALMGAHALGFACLLLLGGAASLMLLPRLFRRRQPNAEVRPAADPQEPLSLRMALGMAAVHGVFLAAGALLLGVLLASLSETIALGDLWRFLAAAIALALPTPALLRAWARSDSY